MPSNSPKYNHDLNYSILQIIIWIADKKSVIQVISHATYDLYNIIFVRYSDGPLENPAQVHNLNTGLVCSQIPPPPVK